MAARLVLVAAVLISLLLPAQAHHIATHPVDEPDAGSFSPSLTSTGVDLALVLAVDVSPSMDVEELTLQRQGFIEAFRSPEVHEAVRKGSAGRIIVMYVEWAGSSQQQVVVPWTVIERPADGLEFAARLAGSSMHHGRHTSISAVIDFGVRQLREGAVRATRQAIDISGDGANNQGRMVTLARDAALAHNVTINGLPIMLKRPAGTLGNRGPGPVLSRLRHRWSGGVPDPGSRARPVCRGHQIEDRARDCRSPTGPSLGAACRGRAA